LLHVASVPVVLYSLYSQAFRLRQWCVLCLVISGLIAVQTVLLALVLPQAFVFPVEYAAKAFIILCGVHMAVKFFKKYFINNRELKAGEISFMKFKRNEKLFNTMLSQVQVQDNTIIPPHYQLTFGAKEPLIVIDAVTNPLCGFCSKSFRVYYKLLKAYGDKVRVNIIFNIPFENSTHPSTQIVTALVSMYLRGGGAEALEALNAWFEDRNVNAWLERYAHNQMPDMRIQQMLMTHAQWCAVNRVNYTPATIIDGYHYPDMYDVEDLRLLIDDMLAGREIEKEKTPVMANV